MIPPPEDRPVSRRDNPWDEITGRENGQIGKTPQGALGCWPAILVMGALLGLILYLGHTRGLLNGQANKYQVAYAIGLVFLVGALVRGLPRYGYIRTGLQALAWIGVFMAFILAYAYRNELSMVRDRVVSVLVPDQGRAVSEGSHVFEMANDGHFYIQARVNGLPVLFLADTGATNIVLTKVDAQRIGLDTNILDYDGQASTANGFVRVARVSLDSLRVGEYTLEDFPASVNEGELDTSLLGMRFFSGLESYQVEGKTLTIRWSSD